MTQLQRPALRRGARVAVVSPASAAKPEFVERGCAALRAYGYDPLLMPHALDRGPLYFAGTAQQRAEDLHSALTNPTIDGVLCTRGGWGSAELLPLLDNMGTAAILKRRPKVFVGYSDHTSLHTWLCERCGIMSFYAPMVAADWSSQDGADLPSWRAAMSGEEYTFTHVDGLRPLRSGEARGQLLGGCLAILEAGLATPWSMQIHEPGILFLEDIGVKPFQWDRMLQHLRFAGLLDHVVGIVFGDTSANVSCEERPLLEAACLHALRDLDIPIAIGLRCGHVSGGNRSLVLGEQAWLTCLDNATLKTAGAPAAKAPEQAAETTLQGQALA